MTAHNTFAVALLLLAIASAQVLASEAKGPLEVCKNRTSGQERPQLFDMYKLTLHSRGAYCEINQCDKLPKGQVYPHPPLSIKSFTTMHSNGTEGPTSCMNVTLDLDALKEITPNLTSFWPSFDRNVRDEDNWKQQAREYGSCAICQDGKLYDDIAGYFNTAVRIYTIDNIFAYFEKANIKQSREKPVSMAELQESLRGGDLYNRVAFFCKGQRDNMDILQEIRVCMNTNHGNVHCPRSEEGTCKTEKLWYLGNLTNGAQYMNANAFAVVVSTLLAYFISKS